MRDQDLEAVLKALKTADIPPAIDQRILARLNAIETVRSPVRSWWFRMLTPVSLACLLVVCVVALNVMSVRGPASQRSAIGQSAPAQPAIASLVTGPAERKSAVVLTRSDVRAAQSPAGDQGHGTPAVLSGPRFAAAGLPLPVSSSRGAADLPSMLAPPLPVTAQEKLLIQAATGPQEDQLAVLNPEIRERQLARSQEEYNAFFPKPLPQETYLALYSTK